MTAKYGLREGTITSMLLAVALVLVWVASPVDLATTATGLALFMLGSIGWLNAMRRPTRRRVGLALGASIPVLAFIVLNI